MEKKIAENGRNFNDAEAHSFQTILQTFGRTIVRLESRLCQNFTSIFIIPSEIQAVKERHIRVGFVRIGSNLELDSAHKNTKIGFYPKSLRPFIIILCVDNYSHMYMQELFVHFARMISAPSFCFAPNKTFIKLNF